MKYSVIKIGFICCLFLFFNVATSELHYASEACIRFLVGSAVLDNTSSPCVTFLKGWEGKQCAVARRKMLGAREPASSPFVSKPKVNVSETTKIFLEIVICKGSDAK